MSAQMRRIQSLLKNQTRSIQIAFNEAISRASTAIDRPTLIRLLEIGDVEAAAQLFRMDRAVLYPLEKAVQDAIIASGLSVTPNLPSVISGKFGFDGNHPRAVEIAQRQAANLVTYVDQDAVASARKVIADGIRTNRGLNAVARDLIGRKVGKRRVGGIIGLTEQQTDRMLNLRSMLTDPNRIGEYFNGDLPRYKESDRRMDGRVRKAIRDGKSLSSKDANDIAEAYKVKASGARGRRVARAEAFTSQALGRREAYLQVAARDDVEAVTKTWIHGLSVEPRLDHQDLNGKTIGIDEMFSMGDGTLMFNPHDPQGGATHSLGCRCTCQYRVKVRKF